MNNAVIRHGTAQICRQDVGGKWNGQPSINCNWGLQLTDKNETCS
ncbi:hypothetical protein NC652_009354 [Populus alba x Populus x berolinensis]|uniref:Uncharacterized protein n=1 Tax=Populus alba x Populus x berolinensis TaxID=444605 RepID=A0AAD6R986_9ROSI|nr:hypothetical protein NC652_009354 [Populus alba x Populus x berolinensis]KAJ7004472.1 hypothetical protein NC653_009356 [Populus alba x Populus x berolinensis]